MQYFAHTLKACGPLALALVLSACGEETNVADAELSQGSGDSFEEQNLQALETGPSQTTVNRQYSPPQPGASDQNTDGDENPRFLIAEPTFQIDRPTTANLDKTELASNDAVIEAPSSNARADQSTPVTGRPARTGGDTLPVEPPKQLPPETAPVGGDPLVSLVAKTDGNVNGGATQLQWNTENVDSCETSGAWQGDVGTNGITSLSHEAPGEHTYMISCSGAQGTAMAMVTVTVESTSLAWERPSRNADGSALNDLAGYNMYYGTESGRYTQVKSVPDAGKTELDLPVEPGTYYLAVTAYDRTGNESELSNEIVRIVN